MRRGLLVNLALSLGVTLVLLALLEGGARVVEKPGPDRPQVADYIWNWDDKMPGGFYVVNVDAVGWPPWQVYNGDGLRDRTRTREKPAGFTRIAFLGDSVTLGAMIDPAEAYPQLLEARYASEGRRAEVMSVALWGWSTRQERIAWHRIARHYRPDQAVLAICLNDIPELQNNLSRPPRWLMTLHERSAFVRLLVNAEGREIDSVERLFSDPKAPRVEQALQRFFGEIRALRREVEAEGSSFALVVFPFRFQVEKDAPTPVVQQRIAAFCRDEQLRCLDLLPTLASAGAAAFIDYDHLNPSGSQLVAETLRTSGLLAEAVSDPLTLGRALAARAGPGAQAAALWLDAPQSAPTSAAMTAVAAVLEKGEPSERQAAAWALGVAARAAEPFVEGVAFRVRRDESPGVRAAAARALGGIGSRGGAAALLEALGDPNEPVRAAAAQALARLGPGPAEVSGLAAALASPDRYVVAFAAWSLGNLGDAAEPAVAELGRVLGREDTNDVVTRALARIGPAATAAVPDLVRALRSENATHRWRAARTLGRIGPGAEPAVAALAAALADSNGVVRMQAARALGRIGPAAKPAAAALQRATGDRDDSVSAAAREALERLAGRPD